MPQKQRKQNISNEHNIVKNSNWQEADKWAILQSVTEDLNSGLPRNKSCKWQGEGLERGTPGLQHHSANAVKYTRSPKHVAASKNNHLLVITVNN